MIFTLEDGDFKYISQRVYNYSNINLTEKKKPLIISRLTKRVRELGMDSIAEYVKYLKVQDLANKEFLNLIDRISTNYSLFFRESHHFDFLEKKLPKYTDELRIWSAASSTGQEIYSILMTIKEYERKNKRKVKYKLFASDISRNVLNKASTGIYSRDEIKGINKRLLKEYFLRGIEEKSDLVKIKNKYVKEVKFFRQNLNENKYNIPQMDFIFLRNIIIYFDLESKVKLIKKMYSYLKPGGFLILGHSESMSGISSDFNCVDKSIYQKASL